MIILIYIYTIACFFLVKISHSLFHALRVRHPKRKKSEKEKKVRQVGSKVLT